MDNEKKIRKTMIPEENAEKLYRLAKQGKAICLSCCMHSYLTNAELKVVEIDGIHHLANGTKTLCNIPL